MRNALSSENLTLKVDDFGPIIEAEIDLRPLTVFAGPSNTGKSWLAILIYALHRHFEGLCDTGTGFFIEKLTKGYLSEKEISSIIDWANYEILSKKKISAKRAEQRIDLPDFIMRNIHKYIDESHENIIHQICRALGVDNRKDLLRNATRCDQASISIIKTFRDRGSLHQCSILRGDEFTKETIEFPDTSSIDINALKSTLGIDRMIVNRDPDDFDVLWKCSELLSTIASQYIFPWFEPLNESAYYFPADRAGVMHTHRTIVSAIVGNAASAGLRPTTVSTTQLSGVMADFLQSLINIDSNLHRNKASCIRHTMENHSIEIEKNIVGGKIGIQRSALIDYPEFTYQPKGWKTPISLNNASSMVSEIAPIVLFLRNKVMQGNTLIIEEPEAHLHPKMQVEFTQQLAALVQSGVRVILTTHSDWVLQTLANIVRASGLDDEERSHISTAKVALNPDQVGVWLFKSKKSPKGSVVDEMVLDRESGLYELDYDVVSESLYLDNALISNGIHRSSV
ncbi:AAA family ATPase [Thioalkalivibrio sp. HK1]|uniref:AAA family ATPase n=1 Tax=Thioalkalivibrio sp. HK1 TaxID=1469245 RepID=UPI0018CC13F6|nr:AAA family ATPase [Thioalkalivibrio sp. HK1]